MAVRDIQMKTKINIINQNHKPIFIIMSENNLNTLLSYAVLVFFIFITIFGIFLIASVRKFISSVQKIENRVTELSDSLAPVILNFRFISDDLKSITLRSRSQLSKVEDLSESLIEKGSLLINTIDQIQETGSKIFLNSTNYINAVIKGFTSFTNKLKNRSVLLGRNADPFNF